jgi:cold shock CspA family protein
MDTKKLEGQIYAYMVTKGFGFIIVPNGTRTPPKYYLHISKVISGAESIAVGVWVRFSVSPFVEGRLPSAMDVEVLAAQPVGGAL